MSNRIFTKTDFRQNEYAAEHSTFIFWSKESCIRRLFVKVSRPIMNKPLIKYKECRHNISFRKHILYALLYSYNKIITFYLITF